MLGAAAIVAATAAVVVAAVAYDRPERVAAEAAPSSPSSPTSTAAAAGELRDLSGIPAPDGMVGLANEDGIVVGFIPKDGQTIEGVERSGGVGHLLIIDGERTDIRGTEVVDEHGELVGYLVNFGFVELADAHDVDALRDRIDAWKELTAERVAQHPDIVDGTPPQGS